MSGNDKKDEEIQDGNIHSFYDKGSEDIFFGENTKDARNKIPVRLHDKARRILNELHYAVRPQNLAQHEIKYVSGTPEDEDWYELRINQQYRIYFLWESGNARFVRVDDHL